MNVCKILNELGAHFLTITKDGFVYGPQGKLLLRNLDKEWFLHSVTMAPCNMFLLDKVADITRFLPQQLVNESVVGVATFETIKTSWNTSITLPHHINHHKVAKVSIISDKVTSKDTFHKIQRQRKVWWRKLSQWPARIKLSEEKETDSSNVTEVQAEFPFGQVTVETIYHYKNIQKIFKQVKDNKKDLSNMQMVEHVTSFDWGCLTMLCDTYMSGVSSTMHLHSKLVPYKVALCMTQSKDEVYGEGDDLHRFVLYLNNMLRSKGLHTILINSEELVNAYLVPLTVVVKRTSLANGILYVVNRSTSISEDVHISQLVDYISMR